MTAVLDEFGSVWTFGVDTDGRCGQPVAKKTPRTNKMETAGDLAAVHFPFKIDQLPDVASGARMCQICVALCFVGFVDFDNCDAGSGMRCYTYILCDA